MCACVGACVSVCVLIIVIEWAWSKVRYGILALYDGCDCEVVMCCGQCKNENESSQENPKLIYLLMDNA